MSSVDFLDYDGKTFRIGDSVKYVPMHANGDVGHKDCEEGVITSMRSDWKVWVRYRRQHPSAPGQQTPIERLRLL